MIILKMMMLGILILKIIFSKSYIIYGGNYIFKKKYINKFP